MSSATAKPEQLILLAITLVSFPTFYFSYDLQKIIINKAINATKDDFPITLLGFEFEQISIFAVSVRRFRLHRPDQRRVQVLDQRLPRHHGRARLAPPALPADQADHALPAAPFSAHLAGRNHLHAGGRDPAPWRLFRRGLFPARFPGRPTVGLAGLHLRSGPADRRCGNRALPRSRCISFQEFRSASTSTQRHGSAPCANSPSGWAK